MFNNDENLLKNIENHDLENVELRSLELNFPKI